ncbi:MAG: sigma 54-interacting transcriptional regulator [Deltaproteobacteria bacterium]|nr:sigma 54-interacting transcriptional regulator [Deltaproteobacteria bacterium]
MPKDQTSIILDSIADGVFTVDLDWRITSFNRAAELITGIPRGEAIGRHCWEVFRASICEKQCSLQQTLEKGKPILNQSIYIVNSEGTRVPVSISTAILKDEDDRVIGGVETFRDLSLLEELKKELAGRHTFFDIVSKNKEMHRLFTILEQVAQSDSTVLLQGESGTGKELFARAIHSLSARSKGPLVVVNLGALPDTLVESELFGHKAGAFTDAREDRAGRIAAAEGGTLFLDEIGDLSPRVQVRLLRVLQERTYEPLGSNKTVHADIRIVAATNRDLEALVKERAFREDLYYRINVVRLTLPPLRERREDIPLLVDHFLQRFNRLTGKQITGASQEVLAILMVHDFPGNVRELQNVIEHATVLCQGGIIEARHLPDYLQPALSPEGIEGREPAASRRSRWEDLERGFLLQVLRDNNWSRQAAARELGIGRQTLWRRIKRLKQTLWRRIKRLNIQLPKADGRSSRSKSNRQDNPR